MADRNGIYWSTVFRYVLSSLDIRYSYTQAAGVKTKFFNDNVVTDLIKIIHWVVGDSSLTLRHELLIIRNVKSFGLIDKLQFFRITAAYSFMTEEL